MASYASPVPPVEMSDADQEAIVEEKVRPAVPPPLSTAAAAKVGTGRHPFSSPPRATVHMFRNDNS
jgi:hypothetical protein